MLTLMYSVCVDRSLHLLRFRSPLVMTLTMCAVLVSQPIFKCCLLSLVSSNKEEGEEDDGADDEGEGYSRFIPLLLFLVQKKETSLPAKLSVMVIIIFNFYQLLIFSNCALLSVDYPSIIIKCVCLIISPY